MKVICYGDSNTYGYDPRSCFGDRYDSMHRWVDLLGQKTGWIVVNEGRNGREIPRSPIVLSEHAHLLIVMLGTNDLLQGSAVPEIVAAMEYFLSKAELNHVMLIAPPTMTLGAWVPDRRLIDDSVLLAKAYRDLAERMGIRFADAGEWQVGLSYDGVHFSETGHVAFAEGLYKELTK